MHGLNTDILKNEVRQVWFTVWLCRSAEIHMQVGKKKLVYQLYYTHDVTQALQSKRQKQQLPSRIQSLSK